jgi:predicted nucleotide-binding protein
MKALGKVRKLLNTLAIEPVVLMEQPNKGRTVIEKFEEVSSSCHCAVVLMSPDDLGRLANVKFRSAQFRMRQNVVYELGYFCGTLGRRSGAVVLLEFGDVEIPSDIAGVIRINGLGKLSSLKKQLQTELAHL